MSALQVYPQVETRFVDRGSWFEKGKAHGSVGLRSTNHEPRSTGWAGGGA
jgi:hypothetical protein